MGVQLPLPASRFFLFTPDYGMRGGLGIQSSSSLAHMCSFALLIRGYVSLPKSAHSCVSCGQIGKMQFRMQVRSNRHASRTSRSALGVGTN